jgi:hypothetical protein
MPGYPMNTPFPEPVHYSRENSPGWKIKDWETADALLAYLNPNGMSFACFEKPDGSYFQCAGSKTCLTAEARIYDAAGQYRHYVFGKGPLANTKAAIPTTGYEVKVDASQVLQMRHVRLILKPWLEGGDFPPEFTKTDISERFVD